MGLIRLQHDQAHISAGVAGRKQKAERPRRTGPRFRTQPAAQTVIDRVQVVQLVGHGGAGDVQHAAGDDAADLALRMGADNGDDAVEDRRQRADRRRDAEAYDRLVADQAV